MKKFPRFPILPVLILVLLFGAFSFAAAEPARDITRECRLKPVSGGKGFKKALDRDYKTFWRSSGGAGAVIDVTVPAGEEASCVWLQWYDHPHAAAVQIRNENGQWEEYAATEGIFLSDCLLLPEGTTEFRITNRQSSRRKTPLPIAELHIYGAGDLPDEVQVWDPPCEKADLMLLAAHPDDELLWFGGILPVYAGIEKKAVQVCLMVPTVPRRRLEELDGLWTCGVRNYPVFGNFADRFSNNLKKQYVHWGKNRVRKQVTEWVRRFKPDVLVTHDLNGEYGHGAHQICADAAIAALRDAPDRTKYRESWKAYGGWDVPKCYLHLYAESPITFDWRVPLDAFGGRTALEVAQEAFAKHVSQAHTRYTVEDSGYGDCRLFGLYRSLVGPDENHDDLFENLRDLSAGLN